LSTSFSHANLPAQWKVEVNRRVAAHMNRKAPLAGEQEAAPETRPSQGSRAAQAAARVAARYANAPSYSEMLANEARAAVAAAEAASRAALEAQAAAQSVLDTIEAAQSAEAAAQEQPRMASLHVISAEVISAEPTEEREPGMAAMHESYFEPDHFQADRFQQDCFEADDFEEAVFELTPEQARMDAVQPAPLPTPLADGQAFAIRWEPDMPALRREPEAARASHSAGLFDPGRPEWIAREEARFPGEEIGVVEPALPIYANLIEFPRELIAARKVRPRLAEGPLAAEAGAQLSIFEVDPAAISTEPEMTSAAQEVAPATWAQPDWSGIKLGAVPEEELLLLPEPAPEVHLDPALELASLSRRLLSIVFDVALIGAAFVTAAMVAVHKSPELPGLRVVEIGSAVALAIVAAGYLALFFTLARATPGMRYAQLRLCTFDGQVPTRAQRITRLMAMLLSVLPVGLGLAWAIFDDDHMTWHDRLSRTYMRKH
jgi:uncharacterized RDD family membrane protein YckC